MNPIRNTYVKKITFILKEMMKFLSIIILTSLLDLLHIHNNQIYLQINKNENNLKSISQPLHLLLSSMHVLFENRVIYLAFKYFFYIK